LLHNWNIQLIFVTLWVLKLETSSEVRPLHPENIEVMYVTFCVSKLERSRDLRPLQ